MSAEKSFRSSKKYRIAVYKRVSTDRQDTESQDAEITALIEELTEKKGECSVTFFEDKGLSGTDSKRPQYKALLEMAYARKLDAIVVYRLDRFSRNASEAIKTIISLDEAGVSFFSATQPVLNVDEGNPFKRTLLAAFAEIAEIERETLITRVKSGLKAAVSRGVRLGPPVKVTPEVLTKVKALRAEGRSFREISLLVGLSKSAIQKAFHRSAAD